MLGSQEQQRCSGNQPTKGSRSPSTRQQSINDFLVIFQKKKKISWSATSSYPFSFHLTTSAKILYIQESVNLDFSSGVKTKRENKLSTECASRFANCNPGFQANAYLSSLESTFDRQSKVEQYISPQITTLFRLVQLKYKLIRLHVPLRLEQKAQDQLCHCH